MYNAKVNAACVYGLYTIYDNSNVKLMIGESVWTSFVKYNIFSLNSLTIKSLS